MCGTHRGKTMARNRKWIYEQKSIDKSSISLNDAYVSAIEMNQDSYFVIVHLFMLNDLSHSFRFNGFIYKWKEWENIQHHSAWRYMCLAHALVHISSLQSSSIASHPFISTNNRISLTHFIHQTLYRQELREMMTHTHTNLYIEINIAKMDLKCTDNPVIST